MPQIPDHIFRGYDIRGVADVDLSSTVYSHVGKAYAKVITKKAVRSVVVGMDNRLTSQEYKDAFVSALLDSGVNVYDIGLSLSQIVYFAQYYFKTEAAAMITASHNPREYNGLKLASGFSSTLLTEDIQELKQVIKQEDYLNPAKKGRLEVIDVFPAYEEELHRRIAQKFNFKVVVDSANGATGHFLPNILRRFGCEVVEQNTNLDGNFPLGTPDPTEKEVQERLAKRVVAEKADLGFSYDADGDRMGVVDNKGRLIWNDVLVALFAKDVLLSRPGTKIVFNVLCSKATSDAISLAGGVPVMWMTGHSFIKAKCKEEGALFGGELSGHFFFLDKFYGHDDGAYSSLRLLSYLARTGKSLSQALDELPNYVSSPEIKLGCADGVKFNLVSQKIKKDLGSIFPGAQYNTIDGVRVDTDEEMAVIRASQNGPYITIKFEGKTQEQYDSIKGKISSMLHKYKEIDFSSGVNTDALN